MGQLEGSWCQPMETELGHPGKPHAHGRSDTTLSRSLRQRQFWSIPLTNTVDDLQWVLLLDKKWLSRRGTSRPIGSKPASRDFDLRPGPGAIHLSATLDGKGHIRHHRRLLRSWHHVRGIMASLCEAREAKATAVKSRTSSRSADL